MQLALDCMFLGGGDGPMIGYLTKSYAELIESKASIGKTTAVTHFSQGNVGHFCGLVTALVLSEFSCDYAGTLLSSSITVTE